MKQPKSVRQVPFERSLAGRCPAAAVMFHPTLNGHSPNVVGAASNVVFYWQCQENPAHVFQKRALEVTMAVEGGYRACPECKTSVPDKFSLSNHYPHLAAEWDDDYPGNRRKRENVDVRFSSSGSRWVCSTCSRRWLASVAQRVSGEGNCPSCHPKKRLTNAERIEAGMPTRALAGKGGAERRKRFVSFIDETPALAKEWHPTLNGKKRPEMFSPSSNERVVWLCSVDESHVWEATISNRNKLGSGCPHCFNPPLSPTNNFAVKYPHLVVWWDAQANGAEASDSNPSVNDRVWFRCNAGPDHLWDARLSNFVAKPQCPYCSGQKLSTTNSVANYPNALALWDFEHNTASPNDIRATDTNTKVFFVCDKGPDHQWSAPPSGIAVAGRGCPFCAGKRPSVTNSLAALYPGISAELDVELSGIEAADVVAHGHKRLWWRCRIHAEHVWEDVVKNRTLEGAGCKLCFVPNTSRREVDVFAELTAVTGLGEAGVALRLDGRRVACDWLDHSRRIVVEYDGSRWHANKVDKDRAKSELLTTHGWRVVRLRELPLELLDANDLHVAHTWKTVRVVKALLDHMSQLGICDEDVVERYATVKRPIGRDAADARWLELQQQYARRKAEKNELPKLRVRKRQDGATAVS